MDEPTAPKPKVKQAERRAGNHFNRERAARILVDASYTSSSKAAKKWKINERTVQLYRARLANDLELARLYQGAKARADSGWHDERLAFLKIALAKLEELVGKADSAKDIPAVSQAVRVVGELQVAEGALNGGDGTAQPSAVAAAPAQHDGGDAGGDPGGNPEQH